MALHELAAVAEAKGRIIGFGYALSDSVKISAHFGAGAGAGDRNQAAFNAGRIVGMLGCGVVGVIGVILQFQASASLKSLTGKSKVITAIVFGFIFGVLFAVGVMINLALVSEVPGGSLKTLVLGTILVGAITAFFNLFAAIKGIVTLINPAVKRAFRRE